MAFETNSDALMEDALKAAEEYLSRCAQERQERHAVMELLRRKYPDKPEGVLREAAFRLVNF